ncbi:hypothetical protein Tco_1325049 [Tanacetum coccineum]
MKAITTRSGVAYEGPSIPTNPSPKKSPENFHASPNTIIESLPIFPIPVQDSDSHREDINIFPDPDDLIPSKIERDDYDSENDENSTVDEPVLLHTPFSR